jgi:spore germination protein KA
MLKRLKEMVDRLFDPRVQGGTARAFSLKYADKEAKGKRDLLLPPEPEVPPDTPLQRVKIKAGNAVHAVEDSLHLLQSDLTGDVTVTAGRMKEALNYGLSTDVVLREFTLPFTTPVKAYLFFIVGAIDPSEVDRAILLPLLDLPRGEAAPEGLDLLERVEQMLLPGRQVGKTFDLQYAVGAVAAGQCALLLDTVPAVILIDERKFPGRGIDPPTAEQVVRGPQEGFNETIVTNTGLLRRRLKTPDLVFEAAEVGRKSRTLVMLAYLKGVANPTLIAEVRRRLSYLDVDAIQSSGMLEQLIEDSPFGLLPTIQETQRPDRAAASLTEGRVVLLVDGSPYVLVAPVVFGDFFRNPEDYYIKWPFGTILRGIRLVGLMVTLLLPGLYIAVANYHQEMIPSSLLLAIASSRESVPFPAPMETVLMEIAFEIIREGSLRIPSVLGQTVGIVGALILGQAAVQANIVSPILVIIVATTALGSFTIPNYSMSLPIRFGRFFFIAAAASFGLYGIAVGLFLLSAHAAALRSFGVAYLAPSGPRIPGSADVVLRGPIWGMDKRPEMVRPLDHRRQTETNMAWNPQMDPETTQQPKGDSSDGQGAD